MKILSGMMLGRSVLWAAGCALAGATAADAAWEQSDTSLAWKNGDDVIWRFTFDPAMGKPFFHPLTVAGGPSLTVSRPDDHVWHYGLWFSWKFINGANYWEEGEKAPNAGATRWKAPKIETQDDGSAVIRMELTYAQQNGTQLDVTETREIRVTAPEVNGGYTIEWTARFKAGAKGALLDRTPMPGEPDGKVNGGYGGFGARLAADGVAISVVSADGPVTAFESDRARPASSAVAWNFSDPSGGALGGLGIYSDPRNSGERAPWYLVKSSMMRFGCQAILAPKPITVGAGKTMDLRYVVGVRPTTWTPAELQKLGTGK